MKDYVKNGILPITGLIVILIITSEIYVVDGKIDLFRVWMCVGIPFGIEKVRTVFLPVTLDIGSIIGSFLAYFFICGLFGGLIAIVRIIQAVLVLINAMIRTVSQAHTVY